MSFGPNKVPTLVVGTGKLSAAAAGMVEVVQEEASERSNDPL